MPTSYVPGNADNYTIGGIRFYFTEDGGPGELYFGNIVTGSFNSDITFLDHFTAKTGTRVKDRSVVQEIAVVVSLTVDEPTVELMNFFMLGGDVTLGVFAPFTNLERNGSARVFGVSDTGNQWLWNIPKCTLKPDGDFSYNDQDWSSFSFTVEVLDDSSTTPASPYGTVTHDGVADNGDPEIYI